jgi:hypothetical protein
MTSTLETILRDTEEALTTAMHDGKLTPVEVVTVAVQISQKVHILSSLTAAQKEALIYMCLSKGVSAVGGLEAQEHVLLAAVTAAKALRDAIPAPVQGLLAIWLPLCFAAPSAAETLAPKDAALVEEALRCHPAAMTLRLDPQNVTPSQVSVVPPAADPLTVTKENTPPQSKSGEAPSQPASAPASQ